MIDANPFELADPDVVSDEDHDGAEDGEDDAKYTRGSRDGESGICDGDGDGAPGGDGGGGKGADVGVDVDDAGVGFGEEHEHGWGEEDGDDGAEALGHPLLVRWGTEEEADAEVGDEVGGLVGAEGGDGAAEQVEALCVTGSPVFAFCGAAEDDLGGLGSGGEGSDI